MAFGSSSRNTGMSSSSNPAGVSSSNPSSSTLARDDRILPLGADGLYILLSDQGVTNKWHWGLYLHCDGREGWVLHCTRPNGCDVWFLELRTTKNAIFSLSVVTATKIAVVPPVMQEALRDRIAQVPIEDTLRFETLSCRTWLLRAVDELNNEGYISLKPGSTVEDIELEVTDAAGDAAFVKEVTVQLSIYSNA